MNKDFENLREEVLATEKILEDIFEAIDNDHLYVEELPEGYEWDGGELLDPYGKVVEYPDEELPQVQWYDPSSYLEEMPLEVVDERGREFAVVFCTGGPHVEARSDGCSDASIIGYWEMREYESHSEAASRVLDYFEAASRVLDYFIERNV